MNSRRFFLISTALTALTMVLHTIGHFSPPPGDEASMALIQTMQAFHFDMPFGMRPNMFGIVKSLSLTMTLLLVALVLINLMAWKRLGRHLFLKDLAAINALVQVALTIMYGFYQVAPPFVLFSACSVMWIATWLKRGKPEP